MRKFYNSTMEMLVLKQSSKRTFMIQLAHLADMCPEHVVLVLLRRELKLVNQGIRRFFFSH